MCKKVLLLVLGLAFCLGSAAQAFDIILISDSSAPGTDPGGDHCDDPLVAFLQGLGYTVDTSGMGKAYREGNNPFDGGAKEAALNSADLVIVSRRTSSGSYDNDRKDWNELANPLLLMSAYLTRGETSSDRWGWTTGGSGDVSKTETDALVGNIVPFTMFDWTLAPAGQSPKGPYLPNVAGGETVAGDVMATYDGKPWWIDIPSGTDLQAMNAPVGGGRDYGVTGDRRMFMGAWGYDTPGTYEWGDYMTDQYKAMMALTVHELIPEPATIALLGLGGLALLRKRR